MEEAKIGVYVCWCGTNIAKMVDVEEVAKEIGKYPNVVIARDYKYMCSDPGQELIISDIKKLGLNRVVVSACSPRIHELTFRKALEKAGLNPYLFEMANIREQDSWVHTDRAEATRKAKDLVRAALHKVLFHEPLSERTVEINPATLVIGGGIAGMSAALEIAGAGKKVYLVEKKESLGGMMARFDLTFPGLESARDNLQLTVARVMKDPNIEVFTNTIIRDIFGYVGNFECIISTNFKEDRSLTFGNVVVATGLKTFDPSVIPEYKYGQLPDIYTSHEFEGMLSSGRIVRKDGRPPENVAIIHCVGSRNRNYHEYCSRVCCMTALKYANQLRSALPQANIFEIYADMRAMGKGCEELYSLSSRRKIMFLMFDQQGPLPVIRKAGSRDKCDYLIAMQEKLSGEAIEIPADMVILMVGTEAREDAKEVAHQVGISMCGNSFYIEKHPKLDPVATTTNGVYIVGSCQGPKDIPDSISQARAAAARILGTIAQGSVTVEVTTANVNEDLCCGCQTCIKVCPYTAISFKEEEKVSFVNEILCKGCGTCGSACPTGAITCRHFTDRQLINQIEGLMQMDVEPELKEV